jgi:hypothetical protein
VRPSHLPFPCPGPGGKSKEAITKSSASVTASSKPGTVARSLMGQGLDGMALGKFGMSTPAPSMLTSRSNSAYHAPPRPSYPVALASAATKHTLDGARTLAPASGVSGFAVFLGLHPGCNFDAPHRHDPGGGVHFDSVRDVLYLISQSRKQWLKEVDAATSGGGGLGVGDNIPLRPLKRRGLVDSVPGASVPLPTHGLPPSLNHFNPVLAPRPGPGYGSSSGATTSTPALVAPVVTAPAAPVDASLYGAQPDLSLLEDFCADLFP